MRQWAANVFEADRLIEKSRTDPEAQNIELLDNWILRILLTSPSYLPSLGGAQLHVHPLAKELSKIHAVSAVTM